MRTLLIVLAVSILMLLSVQLAFASELNDPTSSEGEDIFKVFILFYFILSFFFYSLLNMYILFIYLFI
jgi:hypothetical protein